MRCAKLSSFWLSDFTYRLFNIAPFRGVWYQGPTDRAVFAGDDMVVGFNHNVRYKGELYHVQTEDGGLKKPQIITHLYRAGTILSSKRVSYADITRVENLARVVEDLMKEQHKEMLRRLKNGDFDELILERFGGKPSPPAQSPPTDENPAPDAPDMTPRAVEVRREPVKQTHETAAPPEEIKPSEARSSKEFSLDDLILSYLTGGEDK